MAENVTAIAMMMIVTVAAENKNRLDFYSGRN